jgi:hypothetical protein
MDQGAFSGALQNIQRMAKPVVQAGVNFADHTAVPVINMGGNILQNLAQDLRPPQTQQLPHNFQSPIPQNQVVPHDRGPAGSWDNSWVGIGANAVGGAISNALGSMFSGPHSQSPATTQQSNSSPTQAVLGTQAPAPVRLNPTIAPTAEPTVPIASPTPTPPDATPTPQLNEFERPTLPVFQQYGVSPAVAYGIAAAEGGRIGQHNIWNINATDSNPNGATNYGSVQQAAEGAARLISHMLQAKGINSTDPNVQLQAVEDAGYAGDPRTWRQRSASTGGAGKTYNSWSQFVKSTPAWQRWTSQ